MCARNSERLDAATKEIRMQNGAEVFSRAFDVTNAEAVHDFIEAVVQKFGSVDIA